jgi:hypothetical protein
MAKKLSYSRLNSMWAKNSNPVNSEDDLFFKKSMDDICHQAEMAESTVEYVEVICSGMKQILLKGISTKQIINHENFFKKLTYLGRDLMENSNVKGDLFYIGILLELKILQEINSITFFQFVSNAIKSIKLNINLISKSIKDKLIDEFIRDNYYLYCQYFIEKKYA